MLTQMPIQDYNFNSSIPAHWIFSVNGDALISPVLIHQFQRIEYLVSMGMLSVATPFWQKSSTFLLKKQYDFSQKAVQKQYDFHIFSQKAVQKQYI